MTDESKSDESKSDEFDPSWFEIDRDTGTITEFKNKSFSRKLVIPKKIGGVEVTKVDDWAFSDCTALTAVAMPEVKAVGNWAFRHCTALKAVAMPKVETVGNEAFAYCTALTAVSIPEVKTVNIEAFTHCTALKAVDMPNVQRVCIWAFSNCTALKAVDMPNVQRVGDAAFNKCTTLTAVAMPEVKTVNFEAFNQCIALTAVAMPLELKETLDYTRVFSRTDINSEEELDELNDKYIFNTLTSQRKLLIAHWADARKRKRDNEAPRKGNTLLELFGKIPRVALAEVLTQSLPVKTDGLNEITIKEIETLRLKQYEKYFKLLVDCIQNNMKKVTDAPAADAPAAGGDASGDGGDASGDGGDDSGAGAARAVGGAGGAGGDGAEKNKYYLKYIKYKNKYLTLKHKL